METGTARAPPELRKVLSRPELQENHMARKMAEVSPQGGGVEGAGGGVGQVNESVDDSVNLECKSGYDPRTVLLKCLVSTTEIDINEALDEK